MNEYLKELSIKVVKTMAQAALAVIGTAAVGITDVDWFGVLSAAVLAGIVCVLMNLSLLRSS